MTRKTDRKCTLKDIARHVGVASSTVSRVLNGSDTKIPVTEETRSRIFEAVKLLDYSPDINALRLSRSKSFIIALVIPALSEMGGRSGMLDATIVRMMQGIEEAISDTPYKILLIFKNSRFVDSKEYLRLFKEGCVDGMMIWGSSSADSYVSELSSLPVVQVNSVCGDPAVSSITNDNEGGSVAVVEKLVAKGRRRFVYLGGIPGNSISVERERGVMKALRRHRLKLEPQFHLDAGFGMERASVVFDEFLACGRRDFDAVVCVNDATACGVYLSARRKGFKIPSDFSLVGADGMSDLLIPLTTVKVDAVEMGRLALRSVIDLVEGRAKAPVRKIVPCSLLMRSTD